MNADPCQYSLWLHQVTSSRLGQFVKQHYSVRIDGSHRVMLGNAVWVGQPGETPLQSRENAAAEAYKELVFLSEEQMRARLMMPQRPTVHELKDVRRTFDELHFRAHQQLAGTARSFALDKIAYVRFQLDNLERDLLCVGLSAE